MIPALILAITTITNQPSGKWYFPLAGYSQRQSYKGFGQLMTSEFYVGKEKLFPTKYLGYHAAKDLEIMPGEENKPVEIYAIGDGKILFLGSVSGYGGVILESLDKTNNTALYGHLKLSQAEVKTGQQVSAGQKLTILSDGFSRETGGERKHLHFGIYNGLDKYFHGYEINFTTLNNKWVDPDKYLQANQAQEIVKESWLSLVIQKLMERFKVYSQ